MRNILPVLLPCLLDCCKFTEADRMSMMPSKDSDVTGGEDKKNNQESE